MSRRLGSVGMLTHGVAFNLGTAKVCSPAIFETYLSYDKDICCNLLLYIILLNCAISMAAICQLINLTAA